VNAVIVDFKTNMRQMTTTSQQETGWRLISIV